MDHAIVRQRGRGGEARRSTARKDAARERLVGRGLVGQVPARPKEATESGVNWSVLFRNFALNQRSLQVQIRQMIVAAIEERRLVGNARMPSSRELALSLGVARNTVVLAYRQLVDEGFLESRERSGYFVADLDLADVSSPSSAQPLAGSSGDPIGRLASGSCPRGSATSSRSSTGCAILSPSSTGNSIPSLFPTNDWRESARGALSVLEIQNWARDLIDGDDPELIDQLRVHVLPRAGIWAPPEEIIVTVGAQQALFMLAQLFLARHAHRHREPRLPRCAQHLRHDHRKVCRSPSTRTASFPATRWPAANMSM